ncbi:MAG: acetylxylan esterase, partial [bacterium]|nr:acetylxylan esterase [bacterium]
HPCESRGPLDSRCCGNDHNFPDFILLSTNGSGPTFGQYYTDSEKGENVRRTLAYIDGANLAPWIKSPTLVCVGLQDRVCPPVNGIVALNRIPKKVPRRLVLVPGADHEITDLMRTENAAWEKKYLHLDKSQIPNPNVK